MRGDRFHPEGGRRPSPALLAAVEGALLLAAPAAAFFGLHLRRMTRPNLIDPYFYTAYMQNGRELMERYGESNYFWVRVGQILPGHYAYAALGAVGGFYAWRYVLALLAIVPAYLLYRRIHGRAAGATAVVALLTCPVLVSAVGSDYPDAAAVGYLAGGTACLLMPARYRIGWAVLAGALFSLAVNSQLVAAATVAAAVTGFAVTALWEPRRIPWMLLDVVGAAAAGVLTMALLSVGTRRYLGAQDLVSPTLRAAIAYRTPAEIAKFHSYTTAWLIQDVYLLAPVAILLAWVCLRMGPRPGRLPAPEVGLAFTALVAYGVHAYAQFRLLNWTLEYYLYTSMLFATAILLLPAVVAILIGGAGRRAWIAPALVLGGPVALRALEAVDQYEIGVAAAIAAVAAAAAAAGRLRPEGSPGRVAAAGLVVAAVYSLSTAVPAHRTLHPGEHPYFAPAYGTALFGDGQEQVDQYAVASRFKDVMPRAKADPGDVTMWWPPAASDAVNIAAAQYLWFNNAIPNTLPALDDGEARILLEHRMRFVVMLSDTGREFDLGIAALAARGMGPRTWRTAVIHSGRVTLHVAVIELESFRPWPVPYG